MNIITVNGNHLINPFNDPVATVLRGHNSMNNVPNKKHDVDSIAIHGCKAYLWTWISCKDDH